MELLQIIQATEGRLAAGPENQDIKGIAIDSRMVQPGYLFAAQKGTRTDGHLFISKAVEAGAVAVLCSEIPGDIPSGVSIISVPDVSKALGAACSEFYNHPSGNLSIIGITGTNGKTSIATWLFQLGELLGYPCGLISTIRIRVRDTSIPATHTTPDIISLFEHLDSMVKAGCQYVFMEVSSHALDQNRVAGLKFSGAVFTNISRDHLDYHEDFASYIKAKKRLFDELPDDAFAIVNDDDRNSGVMLQNCRALKRGYSNRTISDFHGKLIEQINQGMMLQMNGRELWVPFIGRFNVSNITAVYGVATQLGWKDEEILTAISRLKPVEGRFDKVDLGDGVTGIVDYAHTPDALKNVLEAIREMCGSGQRVLTVIGAGGDRDRGKRPAMAATACAMSEIVILTSDNPRSENPGDIIEEMKEGVPPEMESQVFSVINRREAIRLAYALARGGDFVLVAGKGHETYQEINGERKHFDDKEELIKIKSST